nr:hypothetical protein Iba_chr10cCG4380 [Ipomoea batatas]
MLGERLLMKVSSDAGEERKKYPLGKFSTAQKFLALALSSVCLQLWDQVEHHANSGTSLHTLVPVHIRYQYATTVRRMHTFRKSVKPGQANRYRIHFDAARARNHGDVRQGSGCAAVIAISFPPGITPAPLQRSVLLQELRRVGPVLLGLLPVPFHGLGELQ